MGEVDDATWTFIVTLMYDVKSVSAQSEDAMISIARDFQILCQALAELLLTGRYADISRDGLTFSEEDPPEKVSGGELSVQAAGLTWLPKIDVICKAIPRLHFGRVRLETSLEQGCLGLHQTAALPVSNGLGRDG